MYNVLENLPSVSHLVSVGIRDFSSDEQTYAKEAKKRVRVFYDAQLKEQKFSGITWKSQAENIVSELPEKVWISFDIDGLDPKFCPSTGTPVPGGLDFYEALFLFKTLVDSGRQIIGFDLCEVAPNAQSEWDANVGMRMLYQLAIWTIKSQPPKNG